MFTTRTFLAVTALVASLGALNACSGSDSDTSSPGASGSGASPSQVTYSATPKPPTKDAHCDAQVTLTGAVKASWSGDGTVSTSTGDHPAASYRTTHGTTTLQIPAKQDGFVPTPIVTVGKVTYSGQGGKGVKADQKGGGATVHADAVVLKNGKQKVVHVVAEFDC